MARATHEANNQEHFPFQDSEAARWKSDEAAAARRKAKSQRSLKLRIIDKLAVMKQKRTPDQGGHTPERMAKSGRRNGWRCSVCRAKSSSYEKLTVQRCGGSRSEGWAREVANPSRDEGKRHIDDIRANGEEAAQRPHETVESGPTLWCVKCGAMAEHKTVKLSRECNGRPKREAGKSRWGGHGGS